MWGKSIAFGFIVLQLAMSFDLDEEAKHMIETKIIPALNRRSMNYDTNNLRICRCSVESGCTRFTKGWVVGLLERELTKEQKDQYYATCVTDGECYQHAVSGVTLTAYGCMDKGQKEKDFKAILNLEPDLCRNKWFHKEYEELWTCCSGKSYCANATELTPINFMAADKLSEEEIDIYYSIERSFGRVTPALMREHIKLRAQKEDEKKMSKFLDFTFLQFSFVVLIVCAVVLCVLGAYYKTHGFPMPCPALTGSTESQLVSPSGGISARSAAQSAETEMSALASGQLSARTGGPEAIQETDIDEEMLLAEEERRRRIEQEQVEGSGSGGGEVPLLYERTIGHQITIVKRVGEGRFGMVWLGDWKGEKVAVKIFTSREEVAYRKETTIYETRMLRHPNVLRYIGGDRMEIDNVIESWLVTEYHKLGSLSEYLARRPVDLRSCYVLIKSAVNGLAFLHTEIHGISNSAKPGIAHRDLKSKNIMVKNDRTCAIGDFGLSVLGDRPPKDYENENLKCGTVRYLAPEVLGDKLIGRNLYDAFVMADMYSFALVMWEILVRCEDEGFKAYPVEEALPFSEYANRDPLFEEMVEVVYVNKKRPKINEAWKDNPKFKILFSIIRDCWSQNPTARLNSIQVRMRLERQIENIFSDMSTDPDDNDDQPGPSRKKTPTKKKEQSPPKIVIKQPTPEKSASPKKEEGEDLLNSRD